ncbi:MAG: sulfatase-like hydrolase/transferase [Planctomycetota bacterium]
MDNGFSHWRDFLRFAARWLSGAAGALALTWALWGSAPPARAAEAAPPPAPAGRRRPNVVLIMADDLGYECLSSYGSTAYKTPNLDKLAATGVRFTWAFSQPLCTPSRVQIMTGKYNFRNYKGFGRFPDGETTFANVVKTAGYATAVVGKWQLGKFEEKDNVPGAGFDKYCLWTWDYGGKRPSQYWNPSIWQDGRLLEGTKGKFGEDIYCDYLVNFIKENKERPFLAYYPTNLPHAPIVNVPGRKGNRKERFANMIEYMDKLVGRVVATLDECGLRENTLILFTGDNGCASATTEIGGRVITGGKGTTKDSGCHVPLIANWKGVTPEGKVLDDLVDFTDFLPTIAEVTGAAVPAGLKPDGRSFAPQLRGQPGRPRQWVYVSGGKGAFMRDQRWKLYADGRLFDTKNDPDETKALADSTGGAEARAAREKLSAEMRKLRGK